MSDTIGLLNIGTREKYRLFLHVNTRAGSWVISNFRKDFELGNAISTISPIQNS